MNPFAFLVDSLFSIYIMVLMLRVILQWTRADFYNPLSQFVVKITNPLVVPLRRIIPGFGGLDIATLLLIFLLTCLKLYLVILINGIPFMSISLVSVILTSIKDMIDLVLNIFLFAILIQAILSWVNPDPYNPVMGILNTVTAPVLRPFRRLIPPIGGIDISPMIAMIAIIFIQKLLQYLF